FSCRLARPPSACLLPYTTLFRSRVVVPAGGEPGVEAAVVVDRGAEGGLDALRVEAGVEHQVAVADEVVARAAAVLHAAGGRGEARFATPALAGGAHVRVEAELAV